MFMHPKLFALPHVLDLFPFLLSSPLAFSCLTPVCVRGVSTTTATRTTEMPSRQFRYKSLLTIDNNLHNADDDNND